MDHVDYRSSASPITSQINWPRRYLIGGVIIGLIHLAGSLLVLWWLNNSTDWMMASLGSEYPGFTLYLMVYEFPFGAVTAWYQLQLPYLVDGTLMLFGDAAFWGLFLVGIWHALSRDK
jgi:hypothetical protein